MHDTMTNMPENLTYVGTLSPSYLGDIYISRQPKLYYIFVKPKRCYSVYRSNPLIHPYNHAIDAEDHSHVSNHQNSPSYPQPNLKTGILKLFIQHRG